MAQSRTQRKFLTKSEIVLCDHKKKGIRIFQLLRDALPGLTSSMKRGRQIGLPVCVFSYIAS